MNSLALALVGMTLGGDPFLPPPGPPACSVKPGGLPGLSCAQAPCFHSAHPFNRLPRICPLEPLSCSDAGKPACEPWIQEFHQAAHFPLPRFAADGSPIVTDGLLIYEGMRLTVNPDDGTYDLSFTAAIPDMPTTVRLQLIFSEPEQGLVKVPAGANAILVRPSESYRITLPPIRIEPRANFQPGDPAGNTFQITHRGYSTLLLQSSKKIEPNWSVQRVGTARFGTPIVVGETNR